MADLTKLRILMVSMTMVGVLLGCITGCSSSSNPSTGSSASAASTGTVSGTLHLAGGPSGTDASAVSGEIYVFASADLAGTPAAKKKTASDGTFSFNLTPGTYYLAATSASFTIDPPPATPPCRGDGPAVVSIGRASSVQITCDMK